MLTTSSALSEIGGVLTALSLAISPAAAEPRTQDIAIQFDARAGEASIACGAAFTGVGTSSATVQLQDFRVYVSNFRLITREGAETPLTLTPDGLWQGDRVALLDFENATGNCNGNDPTNTVVRGSAPEGEYVGLVFDIGVPADLNHQDPTLADAPLNFSALTWPWRYGYKFTTIDLETGRASDSPESASREMSGHDASGFSIHLGSVDCGEGSPRTPPDAPCATPNRPTFRLSGFDPATQLVVLDLAALLAETDVTVNAAETASGCMSGDADDDCVGIMKRLGLPFRGQAAPEQQFVRAEPKLSATN